MLKLFPCNFVYSEKIQQHDEIKLKYLPKILQDSERNGERYRSNTQWYCKVTSSFFAGFDHNFDLFDEGLCNSIVWNPLNNFLSNMKEINSDYWIPSESEVSEIWYNLYQKGDYQDMHTHLGPLHTIFNFSGIYILSSKEPNKTVFKEEGIIPGYPAFNYEHTTENLEEGTVLIFPSSLLHMVKPCEDQRVTISFNIKCQYN